MNEYKIDNLFPSTVLVKDFEIPTQDLVDFSKKFIDEHGNNPFYSPCKSTVHAKINVLELPEFSTIKNQIIEMVKVYCDVKKISTENLAIVDAWLNIYDVNGYQDLHHHPDSMISGVYYIVGTDSKDFIFQAPWYFGQPSFPEYIETNLNNCYNVEYESLTGRCILFMSHLHHRTIPATKQRISLSFNIRYT